MSVGVGLPAYLESWARKRLLAPKERWDLWVFDCCWVFFVDVVVVVVITLVTFP